MHNKRVGRYDEILKIEVCCHTLESQLCNTNICHQWARTPPSASWRFDDGRDNPRARPTGERRRSPRRRSVSPRRDRGRGDYSPRKDDRRDRDRDYDRRDRGDRSRSPEDRLVIYLNTSRYLTYSYNRDREVKEERDRDEPRENGTNGEDRKGDLTLPTRTKD